QEAGREVTYLVRPRRAEVLRRDGMRFVGPDGDRTHRVRAESALPAGPAYDLVVMAVKAPGLEEALVTAA
ncbi:2-dehydropantoate 2-reductase, partial [Streptomyces sp. TRM76130]|nr:2-dehydropantoate 2-reductase [Streptomyces sp. TRM76130]